MPDTNTTTPNTAAASTKEKTAYEKFRDSQGLAEAKGWAGTFGFIFGIVATVYCASLLGARTGKTVANSIGDRTGMDRLTSL